MRALGFFTNYRLDFRLTELNFPSITFVDVMDILIVSFLIYSLTVWIKETRAWTLFKGLLVVFLFGIIAVLLHLNTILWILTNTLSVALIAIIVIFQPELRKALEELGKGQFIAPFIPTEESDEKCSEETFDAIVDAIRSMSMKKTGALILIEQEVPLGDFETTGIKIDSVVTSQLIINVFEHNTPLHDGAMIIKNNRVAAASCFLPLTEAKLSMELGTRHRAAVGASEVSDAFIIVVSEETGDISVAKSAKLYRKKTPEEVKVLFFGGNAPVSNKKKKKIWKGRKKK